MFWVVVAVLYFVLAAVAPSILGLFVSRARTDFGTLSLSLRFVFMAIALLCLAATSYVHVDSDEIAVLNKIYGTTSLPGEHIIATNGEKGPQAEILTPGWHPWFLVNVIYQVETRKVVSVPSGKYGFLNAKDGAPLQPDQYLADAFPAGHELDMLDAEYFPYAWRAAGAADDDPDARELSPQHLSLGRRHPGRRRRGERFCRRGQIQRRGGGEFRQSGRGKTSLMPAKDRVYQFERRSGHFQSTKRR